MKLPWKQRGEESSPRTTEPAPAPSCSGSEQRGRLRRKGRDGGQALSRAEAWTRLWLGCPSWVAGSSRACWPRQSPGSVSWQREGAGKKRGLCPEAKGDATRAWEPSSSRLWTLAGERLCGTHVSQNTPEPTPTPFLQLPHLSSSINRSP